VQKTIGATIEIVETQKGPVVPGGVLVPNDVRINGQSLHASAEHPVIVHQVTSKAQDLVYVTLTLLAHRVEFKAEQVTE
jgi:hypothetical protein